MPQRTIITLAIGPHRYARMALAMMESCRRFGGDRFEYRVYSDRTDFLPHYRTPARLRVYQMVMEIVGQFVVINRRRSAVLFNFGV